MGRRGGVALGGCRNESHGQSNLYWFPPVAYYSLPCCFSLLYSFSASLLGSIPFPWPPTTSSTPPVLTTRFQL